MDFLSHPLLIAIVSILLGSGLIDRINRKKEKRIFMKNEAIKLVEEISDVINDDLTWLFAQVRSQSFIVSDGFLSASRKAFSNRLKIKVKVKTYLNEEDILKDYESIIKEISLLRREIEKCDENNFNQKKVEEHISELKIKWNILNDYPIDNLKFPFNLYFSWSQVIWYRGEFFITKLLIKANSIK